MAVKLKTDPKAIKPQEPKKWFFGQFMKNGEVDYVIESLLTEEEFLNQEYDADYKYFRIDPIHIEHIKVETKIVKA